MTKATCAVETCNDPMSAHGYCNLHHLRWRRHGDPLVTLGAYRRKCTEPGCDEPLRERGHCRTHAKEQPAAPPQRNAAALRERNFWAQVDKDGSVSECRPDLGPCWIWVGYVHPGTGYGQFGVRSGTRLPHRIAYQYLVGPIPKGKHLDHLCRRRTCCRPSHLEPVTPRENISRGDQGAFWGYVPDPLPVKPKVERPTVCTECGRTDKPVYKRGHCRPCYRKWMKDPNIVRPRSLSVEDRFWVKVEKTDSCWLWTAGINAGTGYGMFARRHGEGIDAHRFSYELAHGSIPEGHDVHHTCHVRRCVNPAHLQALTRSQNLSLRKVRRVA